MIDIFYTNTNGERKEDFHQRLGFNLIEVKFRIMIVIRILKGKL